MSAEQLLGSVTAEEATVVADLEAGIGTLTRLADAAVDVTVVVVEPTPRSIDVAKRAVAVATEKGQGRVVVVANKVTDDEDRHRVRAAFDQYPIVEVPSDDAIDAADRLGVSPLDHAPDCPAVLALSHLSDLLS